MFSIGSANSLLNIKNSQQSLDKIYLQMQTGRRINNAADDAAGLAISNQLKTQSNGLAQAIKNANDGVSVMKIADSALTEYTNILQQARDKASQAVSDSNSVEARAALEADVKALLDAANVIATNTSFNGINLLDGSFTAKTFQTGAYSGQTTSVSIDDTKTATLGLDDASVDLTTSAGAAAAMVSLDAAIKTIDGVRSDIGSTQLGFESKVRNMQNTKINIDSAHQNIVGANMEELTKEAADFELRYQASLFSLQKSNELQQSIMRLLQ